MLFTTAAQASTVATGSQPIHEAAVSGKLFKVRSLLKGGANKNARDGYNNTPLMLALAAPKDKKLVAALLIEKGANVHAQNNAGNTALHFADSDIIAELLLKADAKPNVQNKFKQTPLHIAMVRGQLLLVKLLLLHGANPKIADKNGITPLHLAMVTAHMKEQDMLKGAKGATQAKPGPIASGAIEGSLTAVTAVFIVGKLFATLAKTAGTSSAIEASTAEGAGAVALDDFPSAEAIHAAITKLAFGEVEVENPIPYIPYSGTFLEPGEGALVAAQREGSAGYESSEEAGGVREAGIFHPT